MRSMKQLFGPFVLLGVFAVLIVGCKGNRGFKAVRLTPGEKAVEPVRNRPTRNPRPTNVNKERPKQAPAQTAPVVIEDEGLAQMLDAIVIAEGFELQSVEASDRRMSLLQGINEDILKNVKRIDAMSAITEMGEGKYSLAQVEVLAHLDGASQGIKLTGQQQISNDELDAEQEQSAFALTARGGVDATGGYAIKSWASCGGSKCSTLYVVVSLNKPDEKAVTGVYVFTQNTQSILGSYKLTDDSASEDDQPMTPSYIEASRQQLSDAEVEVFADSAVASTTTKSAVIGLTATSMISEAAPVGDWQDVSLLLAVEANVELGGESLVVNASGGGEWANLSNGQSIELSVFANSTATEALKMRAQCVPEQCEKLVLRVDVSANQETQYYTFVRGESQVLNLESASVGVENVSRFTPVVAEVQVEEEAAPEKVAPVAEEVAETAAPVVAADATVAQQAAPKEEAVEEKKEPKGWFERVFVKDPSEVIEFAPGERLAP